MWCANICSHLFTMKYSLPQVLDELYRILNLLQQTDRQLPRSHEFLQELRDISSMAMEHFEENVVPRLKNHISPSTMSITGNILSDVTSCPSKHKQQTLWTACVLYVKSKFFFHSCINCTKVLYFNNYKASLFDYFKANLMFLIVYFLTIVSE